MSTLFGYYGLGLASLRAAQSAIEVSGDNIANINTPGFARRRLELQSGFPVQVAGGFLSHGVDISRVRRMQDNVLQFNLERQQADLARHETTLAGLEAVEALFGSVQGENLSGRLTEFSRSFTELAARPEDPTLRRAAIISADQLARRLQTDYRQLEQQRGQEDQAIRDVVGAVNQLAGDLARLNERIATTELGGQTNSPLRDRRQLIVEQLAELTGGNTVADDDGRLQFNLPGGGTLVTSERARPIEIGSSSDGTSSVRIGETDLTATLRGGELGAYLDLRDRVIPDRLAELDTLAADIITRSNALTNGASDLDGNPGVSLFEPDPAPGAGAASLIAVNSALLSDVRLLAVSATGSPGDGTIATEIAALHETPSAALGDRSAAQFLSDMVADLGNRIGKTEVDRDIAAGMVNSLGGRRQEVSGVSLDEEAVELIRFQRSYEAAARFIQTLNELTAVAIGLGK